MRSKATAQLDIAQQHEASGRALTALHRGHRPLGRSVSARVRLVVLACFAPLLLQIALVLAVAESGPLARLGAALWGTHEALAASRHEIDTEDFEVRYGFVISRPAESLGVWLIGEYEYTVDKNTENNDDLLVGDCAEVKVAVAAPTVAVKLAEKSADNCEDNPDDDDPHDDRDHLLYRLGLVNSRPAGIAGSWIISDASYTATETTVVEGAIVVGDCVLVKSLESAPTVAVKIVEKEPIVCVGYGDDDDEEQEYEEWEGTIVTFPPTLIGEWSVAIGEGQRVTFTANLQTRFVPKLAAAYAVGRWVEVKAVRAPGSDFVAQRVRVDDYELGEIVVRLESAAYSQTIANEYGLVLTSTLLSRANIYLYTTRNENEQLLAQAIEADERVIWAEVNYVNSVPEDDGYKTWGWGGTSEPDAYTGQSAYQQIRMGNASRIYQGNGVVVAVLDTGVYTPHEQFEGRLRLPSLDVIGDDSDPSEEGPGVAWGHGTHVAGVVAAMAPQAVILPVRVLDENGRGNTFLLAYAIEWVVQQPNVKVINLSLGTDFDSKILRDTIANAVEQGIVVVAAAGNSGTSKVQYPAGYHDVVGVTAVDGNSIKADFANFGTEWVDVAAPGVAIMSTMISEQGAGYATWSGTSMATAFVSGAAVLVVEKWNVESAHDDALLAQLVETGLTLDALNPIYAGQIGRQLDVSAALEVDAALLYVPQTVKD